MKLYFMIFNMRTKVILFRVRSFQSECLTKYDRTLLCDRHGMNHCEDTGDHP